MYTYGGRMISFFNIFPKKIGPKTPLRVGSVHVSKNILTLNQNNTNTTNYYCYKSSIPNNNNNNNNITPPRKREHLYILSPKYSSSSSLSSSSSSSLFNNNNNNNSNKNKNKNRVEGEKIDRVCRLPFTMGAESRLNHNHQNGVVDYNNNNNADDDRKQQQQEQDQHQCTKLITLPTVLTLSRVAAIPLFIATFYVNSWWGTAATTSIFVAAAITDWLDGYLARKMRQGTAFGAFLDPVADKLMVAATLILLCSRPPENALLGGVQWLFPVPAIAIIGREITMSAVREWAASQNTKLLQAVAVNNLGKWKTATQMTALTILVATRDSSLAGSETLATTGVALLYISAGLAIWSLIVYMRKIWKVLLR